MSRSLYHHRGMMQDRQALLKLKLRQRRQRRRDEIERLNLAKQFGIEPKDLR